MWIDFELDKLKKTKVNVGFAKLTRAVVTVSLFSLLILEEMEILSFQLKPG